ncbi:hypothetical protein NT6N_31010 [Oceaniferula spumae]|uniref:Uncharacterized protein n=1 Tax=Oceaniferula spumae TaxID=2979115 RepID=A0AAT9FPY8_9BACT
MEPHQQTAAPHSEPVDFWLKVVLVGILVIGGVLVFTPVVMKSPKKADMTTSTSNAKQIFLLMVEFDDDFGEFPSDATANKVPALAAYRGKYSNDYLGQFIAGGYVQSEEIFYAKGGSSSGKKPDNVYDTKDRTLSEGECGFAYIKGLSTSEKSGTPVLLAPMYGDGYKFNSDIYHGKCVVLRIDGSVQTLRLNEDRHAKLPTGKTLFEGGEKTVWGKAGFDYKNLCYAKYPYNFTPAIFKKEWITPPTVAAGLIILALICYIVSKVRGRKKKPNLAHEA